MKGKTKCEKQRESWNKKDKIMKVTILEQKERKTREVNWN